MKLYESRTKGSVKWTRKKKEGGKDEKKPFKVSTGFFSLDSIFEKNCF